MRTAMLVLVAGLPFTSAAARADDTPKGWAFTGRTQAAATVEVRPRVTGELTRVAVKEGAAVKKGDLLVEIDPRPYRIDLDAALARVKAAEAKLQASKLKTTNAKKLTKDKVISQNELALNMAAESEVEAGLAVAKAEAERAKLHLSWTRITAPFDGRVSRVHYTEGNLVVADRTPILKVVATHLLRVSFDVPEATLLRLRRDGLTKSGKLGVAVGFAGDKGYPHEAKLDLIAPEVDPKTGTVRFRAALANPKGLLSPGMQARVHLTPPPK